MAVRQSGLRRNRDVRGLQSRRPPEAIPTLPLLRETTLQALTLGLENTAIGTYSMFSITTGSYNTAVGAGALDLNSADSNTATGAFALLAMSPATATRPMEQTLFLACAQQ